MSTPKKLDLPLEKLAEIAQAINENIIANKSRSKQDKIPTDIFIQTFGINRKNFSETIKGTEIKYNKSTFTYDIPQSLCSNNKVTSEDIKPLKNEKQESNNIITPLVKQQSNNVATPKESNQIAVKEIPTELRKLMTLSDDIQEMITWYQRHKDDDKIIEVPEININHPRLKGATSTRSFKTYTKVMDDFAKFCKNRKETQKDLVALALVEFMERYKN